MRPNTTLAEASRSALFMLTAVNGRAITSYSGSDLERRGPLDRSPFSARQLRPEGYSHASDYDGGLLRVREARRPGRDRRHPVRRGRYRFRAARRADPTL